MTNRFKRTRDDHRREYAEDYLELIEDLVRSKGEARAVDLATHLGVSHVTVGKTVRRLAREGLVTAEPYQPIFATTEGKRIAALSRDRHETVVRFLCALGVSSETAEIDAEGIEHHVSAETLTAMQQFVKAQSDPETPSSSNDPAPCS
ncbi:MAG: manganese-binding transcriptional regulator MntR [Fimbriimonadaceae bacterium]